MLSIVFLFSCVEYGFGDVNDARRPLHDSDAPAWDTAPPPEPEEAPPEDTGDPVDFEPAPEDSDPAPPVDTAPEDVEEEPPEDDGPGWGDGGWGGADSDPPEEEPPEEEPPEDELPVASCAVAPNPVAPPFESATWSGGGSYDPMGMAITDYDWRLTSTPGGSAVVMPMGGATRAGFTPDLAGDYTGQLTVTTSDGRVSEPCEAVLEAVPVEDLWVEMFWTHSGDDMDLHLLKPGGRLESDGDCYWANCAAGWGYLDWGARGDSSDDPTLDLDDIPNTGPENINVPSPETGAFTVVVHDYPTSTYTPGNDVTVNIYVGGALVWSDTRTLTGEDSFESFAEIDWPSGAVTGL